MNILIRQAKIVDPSSPFHSQNADVFIEGDQISAIEPNLNYEADQIIDIPGLSISPGWVDVFAHFCDPGFEFKETIETGTSAAISGGFTDVMLVPNTIPVVNTKGSVEYIIQKSRSMPVNLHSIGTVTKNAEGKELSEMYDMHHSGAIAFSDGLNTIQSAGILLKALQYVKAINKTIIQLPDDHSISANGLMHEGVLSTRLGLQGNPSIAEELMIARDIELVKYTGSKIHFTGVSTMKSVELISRAKKEGLQVSCSVASYHLLFTDEDLLDYDTNLKVNPPLRSKEDKQALIEAVLNGTIDCIASHHLPQGIDNKLVEFEYAKTGMINIQTSFAIVKTAIPEISSTRLIELFSTGPRKVFELPFATIKANHHACISLFLPDNPWSFTKELNRSKSYNSSLFGKELYGRPLGIINKGSLFLNE